MSIKIEIKNDRAYIYTPYSKEFVRRIKGVFGSRWTGKAWAVPEEALAAARAILEDVYGESDIPNLEPKLRLRITIKETMAETRDDVRLFGKVLASASGRDSGAWPGADVYYEKGRPYSGGSAKYWCSCVEEGSVITLTNVLRRNYEADKNSDLYTVEILTDKARRDLEEEKEKLLKRLAEIEEELKKMDRCE